MIYELRTYMITPGKMPDILRRFEMKTLAVWERMGIRQVGFWTTLIGHSHLQLIYMLVWESMAERETKWDAFTADPEWKKALADSERDGVIVQNCDNQFLRPTSFSALK